MNRLGRYALVKLIGRGGMADVWVGKSYGASGFEKIVAIKLLAPDNVDKEDYQRALTDEARILVTLKHPNIVDVYDLNFEAENPYLVMEFVEGAELRDILRALRTKNRRMPLGIVGHLMIEVSKALSHAHERRDANTGEPLHIVHRDVSPSNVLISTQGDVKLSDFGIAKSSLQSAHTQVGLIKGKFRYMSPEQAEGRALDHRSDIFSFGLLFYESLFGRPAYDEASDIAILQRARTGSVAWDVCEEDNFCDEHLKAMLQKLLASSPQERYAELASFRKDLVDYLNRRGEVCDREDLSEFLRDLDLPQLQKSIAVRKVAEDWSPEPTAQFLTQTGVIQTLADIQVGSKKKYWLAGLGGSGVIALAAFLLFNSRNPKILGTSTTSVVSAPSSFAPETVPSPTAISTLPVPPKLGRLDIKTTPADASLSVKYADRVLRPASPASLPDVPLGIPIEITASKKGYKTSSKKMQLTEESQSVSLVLSEIQDLKVSFTAEPNATQIAVPGVFQSQEGPIRSRSLPPGDYDVLFTHEASGKKATARLRGREGGSFLCSADMSVSDDAVPPKAFCRAQ